MDQDPTWYEIGLGHDHIVLDGTQLPQRSTAPSFRPMSIVAKRSPISATAEHLWLGLSSAHMLLAGNNTVMEVLLLLIALLLKHRGSQSRKCVSRCDNNNNKWSKSFDTRLHRRRAWMVQSYSSGCANVHVI